MAKLLQDAYENDPKVRIVEVEHNLLFVWARAEVHLEIDKNLRQQPPASLLTELVVLSTSDGNRLVATLKRMFKEETPYLEYVRSRNSLLVRGTARQIHQDKKRTRNKKRCQEKVSGPFF